MLKKLTIINYAVIEQIEVEFDQGFCVITGETGAGKSILMDALELVLGNRTDAGSLRNKEKKCILEACFQISTNKQINQWIDENNFDSSDELILRREFSAAGKSRAFLNDSPVSVSQLKQIRNLLINLHQQFEHTELLESDFQRQTLDLLAGCQTEVMDYHLNFQAYKAVQKEVYESEKKLADQLQEHDYRQFLLSELNDASFRSNELEETENKLSLLEKAEDIAGIIAWGNRLLNEGDQPFLSQFKSVLHKINGFASLNQELLQLGTRMQSIYTELQDLSQELRKEEDRYQPDEQTRKRLEERYDLGIRLLKKHHVKSTDELLSIQKILSQHLDATDELETLIRQKKIALEQLEKKLHQEAEKIRIRRSAILPAIIEKMNRLLQRVGMPNARFSIELKDKPELTSFGKDEVHFLFHANIPRGEQTRNPDLVPIGKVASGGELSRLMLCIQSLIAESTALPVLVFDEIDSGISGEAARQVALLMKQLSSRHQVLAITHLPQVAAIASSHYFVFKQEDEQQISTKLRKLSAGEHTETIARMIGGEELTESTLAIARELIERVTD